MINSFKQKVLRKRMVLSLNGLFGLPQKVGTIAFSPGSSSEQHVYTDQAPLTCGRAELLRGIEIILLVMPDQGALQKFWALLGPK